MNFKSIIAIMVLWNFIHSTPSHANEKKHGIALIGEPKYKLGFPHFDNVNPKAPKGGSLKIGAVGTFDSLNPYAIKGIPAAGTGIFGPSYLFDTLMTASNDEPESLYGLLAESLELAEDKSWMIFNLNKKAKFSDGTPVRAEDVKFTVETLQEHGTGYLQAHYKKIIKIEILDSHRIKFTLQPKVDELGSNHYEQDLPLIVARLMVMPKHSIEGKDFSKLTQQDMIGSGPYRIKHVKMGRTISYERREDYWAKDLNVRIGTGNFNIIQFDYYRNIDVMFEAFKAGEFDILIESDPKRWATSYGFPAVKNGKVKLLELNHQRPVGFRGFVMNTRRALFKDEKIREALTLVFDFNWVNHNLYYDSFIRSKSYFENTILASSGLPTTDELKLLNPLKDKISPRVFTQEFVPVSFTTNKDKRSYLMKAQHLLQQAGCILESGKLIHPLTRKPFTFELMITRIEEEKLGLALQRDLKQLGIHLVIKNVDETQYWGRTFKFDFDMVIFLWAGSSSPSGGVLMNRFGTKSYDRAGSLNYMGVNDPVIDHLCRHVGQANSLKSLATATKALDRVLLWGHYVIPLFHDNKNRVAIWDKFDYPSFDPKIGITTSNWWYKQTGLNSGKPDNHK